MKTKRNSITAGVIAVVLALGSSGSALADAQGNASCVGFEASGVAPPGSSDEFPGGVAELQAFLKDTFGHEAGAVISAVAKLHEGSHAACDEATE
jgi:ABC-type phosphate/phosphonate transport system substrate-binding protein